MSDGLTIGRVSERTGVAVGTLRMWESRFGFPRPERAPSGHRRYAERDVEAVDRVVRDRQAGLSLAAAIARAREAPLGRERSIYAGLRQRCPDLVPQPVPKRVLAPVSRALEDECLARAERAVLIGSFQDESFYRESERRWRELARTAALALVFADFPRPAHAGPGPIEVPVDRSRPLSREWAVICHAPGYSACLAAWELPDQDAVPDAGRRFETVVTIDPEAVLEGVRVACAIALDVAPGLEGLLRDGLDDGLGAAADPIGLFSTLTARMLAYVGARDGRASVAGEAA